MDRARRKHWEANRASWHAIKGMRQLGMQLPAIAQALEVPWDRVRCPSARDTAARIMMNAATQQRSLHQTLQPDLQEAMEQDEDQDEHAEQAAPQESPPTTRHRRPVKRGKHGASRCPEGSQKRQPRDKSIDEASDQGVFDFSPAAQPMSFARPSMKFGDGTVPESLTAKAVTRNAASSAQGHKHRVPREPWMAAPQSDIERRVTAVEQDLTHMKVDVRHLKQDSSVALKLQTIAMTAQGFTSQQMEAAINEERTKQLVEKSSCREGQQKLLQGRSDQPQPQKQVTFKDEVLAEATQVAREQRRSRPKEHSYHQQQVVMLAL
mmetsp:Transcript_41774/g.70525  ORF Transcript_41774/g.70525 Transcript_41774/m.70525 type:complete len:322 (-) Transcript_41774:2325-3290(-)